MDLQRLLRFLTDNSISYSIKEYKKNEHLPDQSKHMFYLVEGRINFYIHYGDREIISPYIYQRGSYLGLYNLFNDDSLNFYNFLVSSQRTLVIEFNVNAFKTAITQNLTIYLELMNLYIDMINYINSAFRILRCGGNRAYFSFLLHTQSKGNKVFYGRYSDFSLLLNASNTILYRLTNELQDLGVIEKKKKYIKILNTKKLIDQFEL